MDIEHIRAQFPILSRTVHDRPLIYLDSGASAQKPQGVIDAVTRAMGHTWSNVHRGVHTLSGEITEAFEAARGTVARFLGAATPDEIIFTSNATSAMNLLASALGEGLEPGDEVVISEMEHHANIVPWQLLSARLGIDLVIAPITDEGELTVEAIERCLSDRTRLVSIAHVSNVLGTVNPVKAIADRVHAHGARLIVDGAQGAVHCPVDVQALGADFYVVTGHKLYGPSGVGAVYGRMDLLEQMPPWQGGGDMIETVSFEESTFKPPPARFEAGTPPIAQAIGLGAALRWMMDLGMTAIAAREAELADYGARALATVKGLRILGTTSGKAPIFSFVLDDVHPLDLATLLDRRGIAVRVGHHCAEPLMRRMGVEGTTRASLAIYNTEAEIDALVEGIERARSFFA